MPPTKKNYSFQHFDRSISTKIEKNANFMLNKLNQMQHTTN